MAHRQTRRAARAQRLLDRISHLAVERAHARPLRRGLERLDHHAVREQLIAQVGTLEAAAPPRLARCAAEREPVVAARQIQRVPAPRPHLLRGALETEDGKAAVAVTAQGQIGLAQTILQLPAARERERALRLLLVGQPRDIGQRVLLRHRAQRLRTSAELAEEEALVHALCRRSAHTQRQLLDHAEAAL